MRTHSLFGIMLMNVSEMKLTWDLMDSLSSTNVTAGGTLAFLRNRRALLEGRLLNTLILNAKLRELLRYKMGKQAVKFAVDGTWCFSSVGLRESPSHPYPAEAMQRQGCLMASVWGCVDVLWKAQRRNSLTTTSISESSRQQLLSKFVSFLCFQEEIFSM